MESGNEEDKGVFVVLKQVYSSVYSVENGWTQDCTAGILGNALFRSRKSAEEAMLGDLTPSNGGGDDSVTFVTNSSGEVSGILSSIKADEYGEEERHGWRIVRLNEEQN